MNHQQPSSYQHFLQHPYDTTAGIHVQHSGAMAPPSMQGTSAGTPAQVANAYMFGHPNIEDFYHRHPNQHVPLMYQAVEAAAAASNHLMRSHYQSHHAYMLSSAPTANSYFNTGGQFSSGNYPVSIGAFDQLSSIKYQQQQQQNQGPNVASFFPTILSGQHPQSVADAYFNVTTSQSPSGTVANHNNNPLAGLRALSEQYSNQGVRRLSKSPKPASGTTPFGNVDCSLQHQRQGRDSVQPATPSSVVSPSGFHGLGTNSPQQNNTFIPPSPILKSSQTTHSSPLSSTTTHSNGGGFLVGSPATPRGRSGSSVGSADAHYDQRAFPLNDHYNLDGRTIENTFSVPAVPPHVMAPSDDGLTHSSAMVSFYSHGVDPAGALMDPTTAALFGTAHVIGSDPSLHSAVDDALSVLGRDVNLNDLPDIGCASMMVGHNFWDDLGDAVLDDPLLGSHTSTSNVVDLVSNNSISAMGPGQGGLLHSVLEFGTLGTDSIGQMEDSNEHKPSQEGSILKRDGEKARSSASNDLISVIPASTAAYPVQSSGTTVASSDATAATPKLREKMKRKAQGENELAEIDRAFARHLSMVAEKDGHSSTSAELANVEKREPENVILESLTAHSCLMSRLEGQRTRICKSDPAKDCSPIHFGEFEDDVELEELKRNIRKIFMRRQSVEKPSKIEDSSNRKSQSTPSNPSSEPTAKAPKSIVKSDKVPIYKRKSGSSEQTSDKNRFSAGILEISDSSPYNFTDDEDEGINSSTKNRNDITSLPDQESGSPHDETRKKLLDEEVTKKLLQISTLHPELKLSTSDTKVNSTELSMRHVVPKKRQNWHSMGTDSDGAKGNNSNQWSVENRTGLSENKVCMKRKPTLSTPTFVKTEILTDDYSTAMPSVVCANVAGQDPLTKVHKIETPDVGDAAFEEAKHLLPKLIIRIPKKCLEPQSSAVDGSPAPNGMNQGDSDFRQGDREHHHHKRRKRDKRKRRTSEDDDLLMDDMGTKKKCKVENDSSQWSGNGHGSSVSNGIPSGRIESIHTNDCMQNSNGNNITVAELSREKPSCNGLEWDRLPFKLRKKLQRIPSSSVEKSSCPKSDANLSEYTNPTFSNNDSVRQAMSDEQQQTLVDDNATLALLKARFPSGQVFQKGAFVVCKDDIGKPECPLWKVDSQNLLQKFLPSDRQGRTVYVSSSTFSGWCLQNQDLYVPIQVRYIVQSRSECVVELESALEELFPAVSTEIIDQHNNITSDTTRSSKSISTVANNSFALLDHPQADALVSYLNALALHALLGNFLNGVSNNHNISGNKLSRMKEVDLVNSEKCKRLLLYVKWKPSFKEAVEWYPYCTVTGDEAFGLQCQACESGAVCNVFQLFANEGYDFDTLEPRPPRTTASGSPLPSQDYHLCSSCANVAVQYHKLFHMRYQLFRKCEDAVELLRDGNPTLAAGTIADMCMKNKKWLTNTLNEYLQLWLSI